MVVPGPAVTWRRAHRGFLVAALALAVVGFVALAVVAERSRPGAGCRVPPPIPALAPQLRSLGAYDQPYSPDAGTLEAVAVGVAAILHSDLRGTQALPPVAVHSVAPDRPEALVVPLVAGTDTTAASTGSRVEGLVAFLLDCGGRAYYADTQDLLGSASTISGFPVVSKSLAELRLGTREPQLSYTTSPFAPRWRDPRSGRSIDALAPSG